jgi:hypothetical protein
MANFDWSVEKLDASFDRLERTMFIGLVLVSSVWWTGVAATGTLILVNHREPSAPAAPRGVRCDPQPDMQLALSAHHGCALSP